MNFKTRLCICARAVAEMVIAKVFLKDDSGKIKSLTFQHANSPLDNNIVRMC